MPLSVGARLGPYEVVSALGAGGMGEVYRARDTKLGREVAIKILPDAFVHDPDRRARFEREAKTLASLNHPNIATIHGLELDGDVRALVMEIVEGPTLAERIAQGAIPVPEALAIAKQIADALEAAHEHGIIHRDLKPANVKLRSDGSVKVLDFGLAKAFQAAPAGGSVSISPTITSPATQLGVILGTAAYMSPEQAKGREVDRRADIWAFGCVLYEMVTGKRAFEGEDVTETLAGVIRGEPDFNALPAGLPGSVRAVLRSCLQKDLRRRIRDIADVRLALDGAFDAGQPIAAERTSQAAAWHRAIPWALAAIAVAAIPIMWMQRPATSPPAVRRFAVMVPETGAFVTPAGRHVLAVSRDGSRLVYVGNQQLQMRAMDQLEASPIRGTNGASNPFFSPDSQWIGFWQSGQLKKMAVTGGAPLQLCEAKNPTGVSWEGNTILFGQGAEGIWQVSAGGGPPAALVPVETAKGEIAHGPQMLPGGKAVLFTLATAGTQALWNDAQIVVYSLDSRSRSVVARGGTDGRYVASGHLLYTREETLLAQPFDVGRLAVTGNPVPLIEGVRMGTSQGGQGPGGSGGASQFSVSGDGLLAYVPNDDSALARTLVWVDRQGRETRLQMPDRAYVYPRIAPDGSRVALDIRDQEQDIWVWEFARETLTRFTFDPAPDILPIWTRDGQRIVFLQDVTAPRACTRSPPMAPAPSNVCSRRRGICRWPTRFLPMPDDSC